MILKRLITIIFVFAVSLFWVSCRRATHYDVSTPQRALDTLRAAISNKDLETFKRTLSARTLEWLESEAIRTNKLVDELLQDYVARKSENISPVRPEKEERIDGNTVELLSGNGRILGRFVREGDEWKLDGFGWPMKT